MATLPYGIQAEDEKRGLFMDSMVKSCPRNLPGYAGLESEDFIGFKEDFLAAAEDNRHPRFDQSDKVREVLTGQDIESLGGSLWRPSNSDQPQTDALVDSDPAHAADWYLDFGAKVEEILELGLRSPDSAMTCYSVNTIFSITALKFHCGEWQYPLLTELVTLHCY